MPTAHLPAIIIAINSSRNKSVPCCSSAIVKVSGYYEEISEKWFMPIWYLVNGWFHCEYIESSWFLGKLINVPKLSGKIVSIVLLFL